MRRAVALGLTVTLAAAGCGRCGEEKHMAWWGETKIECMGRFCLEIPSAMTRGGTFAVRGVQVRELAWDRPAEQEFDAAWKEVSERIGALAQRRRSPDAPRGRIVEQRALAGGEGQAVCYHKLIELEVTWEAISRRGGHGLALEATGEFQERSEAGARVAAVAAAYVPRSREEQWPVRAEDAFYLDRGRVPLSFERAESAAVVLKGLGLALDVRTDTIEKPEAKELLERFSDALTSFGRFLPGGMSTVRHGKRTVAGMRGGELVVRAAEEEKLYFKWSFEGEPRDALRPETTIELEAPADRQREATALWDFVLDSLRPAAARPR